MRYPTPRCCAAVNRAGGPCRSPVVLASGYCPVHDADHELSRRFNAGPQHTVGPGRPRTPTTVQLIQELIARNPELVLGPLVDALNAVGADGQPDHETRMRAAD